ncbi:hypothetical protein OAP56_04585 [Rickettsiaceae bacterium]|nr:hypothetical protein [Rickettsiaceae bacterium]
MKKKIKKYIYIIVFLILVVGLPAWLYFQISVYNRWSDREQFAEFAMIKIMRQALKQPSVHTYTNQPHMFFAKYEWEDLEPISYEEWMDVKCESPYKGDKDDHNRFGKDFVVHAACIGPQYFALYPNKNANSGRIFRTSINKVQRGIFDSPCIRVSFNEYILKYPKILNNIIKIAEKPCFYLRKPGLYTDLYCHEAKHAWYEAEKSCVVIYILDREGHTKMQMRIPRQDNKHLLKNQKEWDIMIEEKKARIESYNKN